MKTRVALLAVALVGCGHVEVHEVVLRAPSGRSAQPPEIFLEGSAPPRPFYEIALLQAIGFAADATPEDVADALRARAQELGCDALVRVRIDEGVTRANATGVCVRWSPLAAPAAAPSSSAPGAAR